MHDTQTAVRRAVGIMLATGVLATASGVGLMLLGHVALGEVEALLNPAADDFKTRLPAEVLTVIDHGVVTSVEHLAAGTATPQAVEAELTELEDATDAVLGGTAVPSPPSSAIQAVPRFAADHFENEAKREEHARDHAAEFGLSTEEEYVSAAAEFLRTAQTGHFDAVIDKDGIVRIYDLATNTLASFDSTAGVIKTFLQADVDHLLVPPVSGLGHAGRMDVRKVQLPDSFVCPVCGYRGLDEPPYSPRTGLGSYDICPSCRFEYGVTDDDKGFTHDQWRALWIAEGMPWRSRASQPPPDWDPRVQLQRIGL